MTDPGTDPNTGPNTGPGTDRGTGSRESDDTFRPRDILAAWGRAAATVAARFMRPPLVLAGRDPERPVPGAIARAARGFPVVGLAIGLGGALAYGLAVWLGLPAALAAVIAVAVMVFMGGALCESGLARFADAWMAGGNRDEMLDALKSGQLGVYGTLTTVVAFALRVGALAWLLDSGTAMAALIAAACASRAAIPVVLHTLPQARDDGLAAEIGTPGANETVIAVAFGAAVALLFLGPWTGIVALLVGAAGAFKFWWLANRTLGGATGSVLGAAQQGAEIGILLTVVALA